MLFFLTFLINYFYSNKKSFIASSFFSDVNNPFNRSQRVLYFYFLSRRPFLSHVCLVRAMGFSHRLCSLFNQRQLMHKSADLSKRLLSGLTVLSGLLLHIFHSFGGTRAEMRSGLRIGVNPLSSFLKSFNQASVFLRI